MHFSAQVKVNLRCCIGSELEEKQPRETVTLKSTTATTNSKKKKNLNLKNPQQMKALTTEGEEFEESESQYVETVVM